MKSHKILALSAVALAAVSAWLWPQIPALSSCNGLANSPGVACDAPAAPFFYLAFVTAPLGALLLAVIAWRSERMRSRQEPQK